MGTAVVIHGDEWARVSDRLDIALKRIEELENQNDVLSTTLNMYCSPYYDEKERADKAEELLKEILPMAMWESCMHKDNPMANPCTRCCDWGEIVERIQEVLENE